jgi:transcription initiation factor TFIIH subunit 4
MISHTRVEREAMLSLIVHVTIRLPNAVIGVITRSSVKAAFKTGISATQIVTFLVMHVR